MAVRDSPTSRRPDAQAPLGIGIVGCGRAAAQLHLPAVARSPLATATAAFDVDRARLIDVADRHSIPRRHASVDELLADPAVAAVIVCTPPATHAEISLAAVAAGNHVLVEKPLALHPSDAERMVEVGNNAGTVTAVGLNLRCHRLAVEARAIVAAGTLGPIRSLRTTWTAGAPHEGQLPDWRRHRADGGGVVHELGTHHVDLWRYLLGDEIDDLTALCRSDEDDDEVAVISGRSVSGTLVSGTLTANAPNANEVDIVGRDGRVRFSLYRADSLELTTGDGDYSPAARARTLTRRLAALPAVLRAARGGGYFSNSYVRQLERFVAAVHGEGTPAATWADGLQAARIVQAALDSSAGESGLVEVARR